jgi:hypothetical protein
MFVRGVNACNVTARWPKIRGATPITTITGGGMNATETVIAVVDTRLRMETREGRFQEIESSMAVWKRILNGRL